MEEGKRRKEGKTGSTPKTRSLVVGEDEGREGTLVKIKGNGGMENMRDGGREDS